MGDQDNERCDQVNQNRTGFGKKRLLIVVVVIILLIVILGTTLGVVLTKDSSETDLYRVSEYPVVLVSLDGLRADYLNRSLTPKINGFGESGVRAKFLLSQFPTKTFPNHYSVVTGLYPESHGIVFNKFYDPILKKKFSKKVLKDPAFYAGEPIWVTAQKYGKKSASYFWFGSETRGLEPTYYRAYDGSVSYSDRMKQAIKWLKLPKEERPSIITLYINQPDSSGHIFGPNSEEVNEQLRVVDDVFGELLAALEDTNMANSVNLIVVSDHGMSATSCNKILFLDKLYGVHGNDVKWRNLGSVASFNTTKGDYKAVLDKIKCNKQPFQAYYKKNLPKRLHFSNNRRIDDIIVIGEPGELIAVDANNKRDVCENGTHGYDNIVTDMRAIFMARGPSFVRNKTVEHFTSVEIYNLLAALLKINPAPNNGTMGSLSSLLVNDAKPDLSQSKGDGNTFRTDICQFPSDEVFARRNSLGICSYCDAKDDDLFTESNKLFNITAEEAKAYQNFHLPWGLPDGGAGVEGCLLTQPHFIIGYSTFLRIPLWTANRVNGTLSSMNLERKNCFRNDVRLMKNQSGNCASYSRSGYDRGHLVPNGDLDYNHTISLSSFTFANIVPQHQHFNRVIWRRLERKVREWALKYSNVYVISGSIFDTDGDGLRDDDKARKNWTLDNPENPAIPTHFYKIITRCDSNITSEYTIPGCAGSLRVISFILQNTNEKCMDRGADEILRVNVARVKDIELLTGISFFSQLPSLQLQAEIKTFLPVELWG